MAQVALSSKPLTVFISAATAEFEADRQNLKELLQDRGFVHLQQNYPSSLSGGNAIAEKIETADLIICLIGHQYGYPFPPNDRPPDASEGCSWTQWEYDHAREVVRRHPEKRLAVFINKETPPGPIDQRQAEFRNRVYPTEKDSAKGLFFSAYTGKEALAVSIDKMISDEVNGLAAVQYSYWLRIKQAYRSKTVLGWQEIMGESFTSRTDDEGRRRLMDVADRPPFIETRGFQILNPARGRQLEYLKPAAFLTGRDTNAEIAARREAEWRPLRPRSSGSGDELSAADQIVAALRLGDGEQAIVGGVELPTPTRLFIVAGSGIGKSATLSWLEARLNGLGGAASYDVASDLGFAVLLLAGHLEAVSAEQLADYLADRLIRETIGDGATWQRAAVGTGLRKELNAGNVILIIDGLDHAQHSLPLLVASQPPVAPTGGWARCAIVAGGRPHILRDWVDRPSRTSISACYWRFVEPMEFTPDEAEIYLGNIDGTSRLSRVGEDLQTLLFVPRILEYVRQLNARQLSLARTAADIFFYAMGHLVAEGLKSRAGRAFGPDWQEHQHVEGPHPDQIERMLMLLSALGFISLCPTADPGDPRSSELFDTDLGGGRAERLKQRIKVATDEELQRDLRAVVALSSVVGNGILEDLSVRGTDTIEKIMWANRTVQQFFAALWLCRYGDGAEAVAAILAGEPLVPFREPGFDAQRARHYVFYPEADIKDRTWPGRGAPNQVGTDVTYEFNLFLAEMPIRQIRKGSTWIAAASAWYDPALFTGEARGSRIWSTEMLYRSWPTMLHFAQRKVDDWWDSPFAAMYRLRPTANRNEVSPHRQNLADPVQSEIALARLVLQRFQGDFQTIFDEPASWSGSAARDMVSDEQWRCVPASQDFMMGTPEDAAQGCPTGKVDAYWKTELLDYVQITRATRHRPNVALDAAEKGNWKEWFVGGVGERMRAFDVEWLERVLRPLANEGTRRSLTEPDRSSPIYREALGNIERRFKTSDETPDDNPQPVRAFDMHRLPILHRWYSLFAPGHRRTVEAHLAELAFLSTEYGPHDKHGKYLEAPPTHPPDDHPVIYISWFDAWAFCHWATWCDAGSGKRYGLRLPHEPEWEFAARWTTVADRPVPSCREWRWWWGDTFYDNEESPTVELRVVPTANADGRPGRTRPPAEAEANGLGFHDILGNVWEWTATLYSEKKEKDTLGAEKFALRYSRHEPRSRPPVNGQRTMRGGLWYYLNILATCANRFRYVCNDRDFKMGFRVVREERHEP